jgi:peptide/nickel transport system permease protein
MMSVQQKNNTNNDFAKVQLQSAINPLEEGNFLQRARLLFRHFIKSRIAGVNLIVALILVIATLLAPWITPQDPYDLTKLTIMDSRLSPGSIGSEGQTFYLGTDAQGRDMLSAMLYGMRTSIFVALTACSISLIIGVTLGLAAGYFGGITDTIIMRLVDLKLGFPPILIALILLAVMGKGIDKVIIALVLVQWAYFARIVRGVALVETRREYIEAANGLGGSAIRIMFKHLLPNCLPAVIVVGTAQVAHAISLEATLSFLGIGLSVTEPSLGLLIANGFKYLLSGMYWISVFPGVALFILIMSINMIGDRLRDILNPRTSK